MASKKQMSPNSLSSCIKQNQKSSDKNSSNLIYKNHFQQQTNNNKNSIISNEAPLK
jgi:hypothetical protein